MDFCGTHLREPTKEEIDAIKLWMKNNPQGEKESDEDYIARYTQSTSLTLNYTWFTSKIQTDKVD